MCEKSLDTTKPNLRALLSHATTGRPTPVILHARPQIQFEQSTTPSGDPVRDRYVKRDELYAFDLLELNGRDLRREPLKAKAALIRLLEAARHTAQRSHR
jgi:hypothetical protein